MNYPRNARSLNRLDVGYYGDEIDWMLVTMENFGSNFTSGIRNASLGIIKCECCGRLYFSIQ